MPLKTKNTVCILTGEAAHRNINHFRGIDYYVWPDFKSRVPCPSSHCINGHPINAIGIEPDSTNIWWYGHECWVHVQCQYITVYKDYLAYVYWMRKFIEAGLLERAV